MNCGRNTSSAVYMGEIPESSVSHKGSMPCCETVWPQSPTVWVEVPGLLFAK